MSAEIVSKQALLLHLSAELAALSALRWLQEAGEPTATERKKAVQEQEAQRGAALREYLGKTGLRVAWCDDPSFECYVLVAE
jgi:hypothetical protein